MPYCTPKRVFQLGDYWLSRQSRSPAWCRTWFDNAARQTRRVSLRTTDFAEAKQRLNEWYIKHQTLKDCSTDQVTLAELFAQFYEQHGKTLASHDQVRRSLRTWLDFFKDMTVAEASDVALHEKFHEWLLVDNGFSNGTAIRMIGVGKAALNWAWKRGMIQTMPYIPNVKKTAAPPKGRPLSVVELNTHIRHAKHQHLKDFILLMAATAARPDAIFDLTIDQCDLENRLIHLNPEGRDQTKKYRPTVKMPERIVPLIKRRIREGDSSYLVAFNGRKVKSLKKSWGEARDAAGLDQRVVPYSLRHTLARWLRSRGVEAWQVSAQLGHRKEGASTTEIYAAYDPAYLSDAVAAIDGLLAQLQSLEKTASRTAKRESACELGKFACEKRVNEIPVQISKLASDCILAGKVVGAPGFEPGTSTMSR